MHLSSKPVSIAFSSHGCELWKVETGYLGCLPFNISSVFGCSFYVSVNAPSNDSGDCQKPMVQSFKFWHKGMRGKE